MIEDARTRIASVTLVDADVNALTDRAAMGLADHYTSPRAAVLTGVTAQLRTGAAELIAQVEDPLSTVEEGSPLGCCLRCSVTRGPRYWIHR